MKDPYVYEGTNILINVPDIKNQEQLDDYETTMANLGILKLLRDYPMLCKVEDIFVIHKVVFENVYVWAGEKRKINIFKGEPILNGLSVEYSDYRKIKTSLQEIQSEIDEINWVELSKNSIIHEIAKIIGKIWKVHAFREGNTRVVTLFLYYFLKQLDFKVNREFIGKHAKYFRNALVLSSIGEYSEYNYLEEILKDSVSIKNIESNSDERYQTIKGYNLSKYHYNYHTPKK